MKMREKSEIKGTRSEKERGRKIREEKRKRRGTEAEPMKERDFRKEKDRGN